MTLEAAISYWDSEHFVFAFDHGLYRMMMGYMSSGNPVNDVSSGNPQRIAAAHNFPVLHGELI